jgi:hypothetical protein
MIEAARFDEDYFLRGLATGKSLYVDYRWLPESTLPMVRRMVEHCGINRKDTILDFGCLVEGSPIVTQFGVVPIEKLEDRMRVYTHEGQFAEIVRRSVRQYCGDVVSIESRYCQGMALRLTPEHPVYVVTVKAQYKSWKPELTSKPFWLPAKDINIDQHWLVLPRPKRTLDLQVDPDFARLGGYYLAEGFGRKKEQCYHPGHYGYHVCFAFNAKEEAYMDDVRNLMQRFFGTTKGWVSKTGKNGVTLGFYSKDGYFTLTSLFGQGAHCKIIPSHWVNGLSDEAAKQLILGAYRGDGCKSDSNFRYDYSTASLAVSMRMLLLRLGIMSELLCGKPRAGGNIGGRVIVGKEQYHVRSSGEHGLKLAGITGNKIKPVQRTFWYGRMDDNFAYIPIKKLSTEQYDGLVYNMDVQDDHSYAHPTCIVHNCARGYVVRAFRELGYEAYGADISEWAIDHADENVIPFLHRIDRSPPVLGLRYDWVIAKDVLEHIPYVHYAVKELMQAARKGVFVVVPLSLFDGNPYVIADYEKDVTHCQRHKLLTWIGMFLQPGWSVEAAYRVKGIKDAWYKPGWERGNGFLCARRVEG